MKLEVLKRLPENNSKPTPIMFVHGAWHSAWCWNKYFLKYFADSGYASYALSLRGHGNSEGILKGSSINDYVDDLRKVINDFQINPILIGHSMGGLVVRRYIAKYNPPAVILLAPVPINSASFGSTRFACKHPLIFIKANLKHNLHLIVETPELCRQLFFSENIDNKLL